MKILIQKIHPDTKLPTHAHATDAGMDMYACERIIVPAHGRVRIYHGFALLIPPGYVGLVKDKSSISNAGLHQIGGVFDAGYTGEYNTQLVNLTNAEYIFEKGDKVSQLVIVPLASYECEVVDALPETSRGDGAFGSTGKQ